MKYDVVEAIEADHRELRRLMNEMKTQPETRPLVVPVFATLVTAHERA